MELLSEDEVVYFLCANIVFPMKKLKMHLVSQNIYKKMFDQIIYEYLILENVCIDYPLDKYVTTRKKAIHVELFKLKNSNYDSFEKIVHRLENLFEYFDSHEKYFDYYIQLNFCDFLNYIKMYINYDNHSVKDVFFNLPYDEKINIIYFLKRNIRLFLDYCIKTEQYNYISVLIHDLYNIGFDICLQSKKFELNEIFTQMNTIFEGIKLNDIFYENENKNIESFIHDLFWINSQLFMNKSFYTEKITKYRKLKSLEIKKSSLYKKSNARQKKNLLKRLEEDIICPCCLHKYI